MNHACQRVATYRAFQKLKRVSRVYQPASQSCPIFLLPRITAEVSLANKLPAMRKGRHHGNETSTRRQFRRHRHLVMFLADLLNLLKRANAKIVWAGLSRNVGSAKGGQLVKRSGATRAWGSKPGRASGRVGVVRREISLRKGHGEHAMAQGSSGVSRISFLARAVAMIENRWSRLLCVCP